MKPKNLYIYTIGCQMNVYDSEQMAALVRPKGYHPCSDLDLADLVIVNTCTVRAKAEQKAFSFMGRLTALKRRKPNLIVGVAGCVAQQEGERILDRMPQIDFVIGTDAVARLPQLVGQIERRRCRLVDVRHSAAIASDQLTDVESQALQTSRFVTIMQGCDNYCTYCVVPYVRGREKSRTPESILKEIQALVNSGVKEVTLLGQNVNSYGQKEGLCSFAALLAQVNAIDGLERIRFTTSHPKDLSEELIRVFAELERLCHHIHLPVQSGSNRILKRMNRHYTRERYLEKTAKLRTICPEIAITTDIIVGFPGETKSDFEATLNLLDQVAFDALFAFKYSDRPNTPALHFNDKVSEDEAQQRLAQILEVQERHTLKKHRSMIGKSVMVLVEGFSKRSKSSSKLPDPAEWQWTGRTSTNKIVNFLADGPGVGHRKPLAGRMVKVHIKKALSHSLWGTLDEIRTASVKGEGESCYAA